ncbi:MAG: L,D-transpeptidase family protein [Parvularculaceae bacterium]
MRLLLSVLCCALLASTGAHAAVDRILIEKAARRMTLYDGDAVIAGYRIALGFAPLGDKTRQGDGKTPEGRYRIVLKNPKSQFHLSLKVSYPDAEDRAGAAARGLDPGGDIFIHGTPGRDDPYGAGEPIRDWTLGCIAVTNAEIEEIWRLVSVGTAVEITP